MTDHPNMDLVATFRDDSDALMRLAHLEFPSPVALRIAVDLLAERGPASLHQEFGSLVARLVQTGDAATRERIVNALVAEPHRPREEDGFLAPGIIFALREEIVDNAHSAGLIERIVDWLVRDKRPGLATIIGTALSELNRRVPRSPEVVRLVRWMIDHASTELVRQGPDGLLCALDVADNVLTDAPEMRALVLRLILRHERPASVLSWMSGGGGHYLAICRALDRALELLPADFVANFLESTSDAMTRALGPGNYFEPLRPARGMPRLRAAMLRALASVTANAAVLEGGWAYAVRSPVPAEKLHFGALGLRAAWAAVREHGRFGPPEDTAHRADWVRALAEAYFDLFGASRPEASDLGHLKLDVLAFDEELAPGIRDALRSVVSTRSHADYDAARDILTRYEDPRAATLALVLLPPRTERAARPEVISRAEVEVLLNEITSAEWTAADVGVDLFALVAGRRVRLVNAAEVPEGVLVHIDDRQIRFASDDLSRILAADLDVEEIRALVALYFIHEVVHVSQGLGLKRDVEHLRSIGSDRTVLEFDLAADHVAARAVAHAIRRWPLSRLKEILCVGAECFPASGHHLSVAIERKSLRLLSLHVDRALRASPRSAAGFALVEIPPLEGDAVILWQDVVPKLVARVPLTRAEVTIARGLATGLFHDSTRVQATALIAEIVRRTLG